MVPILLIHPEVETRQTEAEKLLTQAGFSRSHPDLKWFEAEDKLGIGEARQIKEFLSLRPYQGKGQAVVILAAENLTTEAQNALLKTLEEPLGETTFILGVASEDQLLTTILSRAQVVNLSSSSFTTPDVVEKEAAKIEKLINATIEERFQFIEKLEKREELLSSLVVYFRHQLLIVQPPRLDKKIHQFLKDLVEAERWVKQNVNIRAILEYLMLKMP